MRSTSVIAVLALLLACGLQFHADEDGACSSQECNDNSARIDLWRFELPGLAQRRQDIQPNMDVGRVSP